MSRRPRKRKWKPVKPKPMPEAQIYPGTASATPETRRNFRKSSFARWCDKGEITGEMMRAAQEIEEVFTALTRGLLIKGTSMERTDKSYGDGVPDKIAWAYKDRYKPWADHLARQQRRGGTPFLGVVIDVLIDCRFAEAIDREHNWGSGTSKRICFAAFNKYAVMAGWLGKPRRRAA